MAVVAAKRAGDLERKDARYAAVLVEADLFFVCEEEVESAHVAESMVEHQ